MQNYMKSKEVTFKPTPPLKRTYTLPSIIVLFPQHQCKSSFRKFTTKSIKTYTTQYNKNMIHNLSNNTLTEDGSSALTKGLSFVPTPTKTFKQETNESWNKFKTRMLTQYFFRNNIHVFKRKSNWTPPPSGNPTLVDFFTRTEQELISINTSCRKSYSNLTLQEKIALNNLKNSQSIVIKPCDKDGGICIMNIRDYLTKIHLHLQDHDKYKPHTYNPPSAIANDACTLIEYMHSQHIIDKATMEFLLPPKNTRTPLFYGLPKIHKPDCPLRTIACGCNAPTDHLSAYITHFTQPLAGNLPSYIKDTKHFLNLVEKIPPLPFNALLVTADVTYLYTNIPHEEGIAAVIHFMEKYRHLLPTNCPPPNIVRTMLDFILKHRTFKFMDTYIHQILGTSMGTRMAPPYANLFMGKEECTIILTFLHLIYFWKCFIDDIFFIFLGSHSQLKFLMTFMNTISPTIKYAFTSSEQTVSFLGVQIYLSESRKLKTKLYKKPTDCMTLLHFNSHHPLSCKEGIIYSQALRYNMIISEDPILQEELNNLTRILLARAYPLHLIIKKIKKTLNHNRS